MANRMKEDEKNEKIIRGLLKLPANRRCINCNSLGPQYVCTNFWTFICTNCSGTHREFTHRVKSISMAKFTSQEVNALQEGGNEHAKEIYFKEWDPQRHSFPDSSNMDKLRDFIKHVYVDRRYTGERSVDKPPRVKGEDANENRRLDAYRGGSRSPPYNETYDRRFSERSGSGGRSDDRNFRSSYEERRSPGYDQGDHRRSPGYDQGDHRRSPGYDQGDYRRSPGRIEVVDERRQDDKFGNSSQNQRFEERGIPDGVRRPEGRSPNRQKDEMSGPPPVRPVQELLGEDVPPLRVGEPPKSNGSKATDGSAQTQRTTSSSSMGSNDGNSVELKRANLGSLIDFNTDPEPPVAAASQQSMSQQETSLPANGENWASFDFVTQQKPQPASDVNLLESALAELAATGNTPVSNASTLPNGGADFFSKPNTVGQWPVMQQNQSSLFPAVDGEATAPAFTPPTGVPPSNQTWASPAQNILGPLTAPSVQPYQAPTKPSLESTTGVPVQSLASSLTQNVQGLRTTSSGQPSQTSAKPALDTTGAPSQPHSVEAKSDGRRELPADLFTATYAPTPATVPGWQAGPTQAMGYGMQYHTALPIPSFPHSSKSTNPFDLTSEPSAIVHAPSFPSMAFLQGALPNTADPDPSDLPRSLSFGATPSAQWVAPQQPFYPSATLPSAYMLQHAPSNMSQPPPGNLFPMGHQGSGGFVAEGPAFGAAGMDQHLAARYSQPGTPNSFPAVGGNPFG